MHERIGDLLIRPIMPADEALYERFFEHVTPEDRRLRFFAAHSDLSHRFLARLTQIDYARAMADAALLALIACLGLAQLSHEVTAASAALAFAALGFYGLATASDRPFKGRVAAGVGLTGLALSGAPAIAALLALGGSPLKGIPGFLLTAMSAPTMLLVGVPVTSGTARFVLAGVTSLVLWCGVGAWAAARATRNPMASWRDWWKEYLWLAVPIWIGAAVAFAVAYKVVL